MSKIPNRPEPARFRVRSPPLSRETWARVLEDYMAGAPAAEVAARYGVSVSSVYARASGKGKKQKGGSRQSAVGSREEEPENPLPPLGGVRSGPAERERLHCNRNSERQGEGGAPAVVIGGAQNSEPAAPHPHLASPANAGEERRSEEREPAAPHPHLASTQCVDPANAGEGRRSAADEQARAAANKDAGGTPAVQEGLVDGGAAVAAFLAGHAGVRVRRHHAADVWAQMRRDYEVGGFTAPVIASWYGATHHAVKKRALTEGWSKLVRAPAPPPLYPPPNAEEVACVDGAVVSAWREIAHDAQLPPASLESGGAWATWLFQGGRGAGKTRAGAEWLAARAELSPGIFALVGPTQHDVREVMVDGPSGLRNLPGRARPWYERSRRRLLWDNGAVAYAFSAEEPERLRGPQFEAAWADEFCIWPRPSETLAILRMGLRRGTAPQLVVTTTPKPIPALRALRAEPSCVLTQAATASNAAHLAPSFLDGLAALYGGTRLAAQELEGLLLDGDGALWRAEDVARARGSRPAESLERVVVGVDPPAGSGGAACGIVVAGRREGRAYVLADRSALGLSPLGWATRVAEAAREFGANEIVAEANQGGDMVRATLASAGAPCAVKLVHASRGKRARAEPIAALYEQGRVTHCDAFPALEEELMALGASESEGLLDRADALVWALTALMLDGGEGPRVRVLGPGLAWRGAGSRASAA